MLSIWTRLKIWHLLTGLEKLIRNDEEEEGGDVDQTDRQIDKHINRQSEKEIDRQTF